MPEDQLEAILAVRKFVHALLNIKSLLDNSMLGIRADLITKRGFATAFCTTRKNIFTCEIDNKFKILAYKFCSPLNK